jgi:NADPH-dependent 2,4-dienoyl-CoA reductase/sulfur reductase-like enzyme
MAEKIHSNHSEHGVRFHLNRSVKIIENDGTDCHQVILDSGTNIKADMLVIGIGVRPDSELASDAMLTVNSGDKGSISVDENLVTNDPDILAIGDVALKHTSLSRVESVNNAQEDAKQAAAHLMNITEVSRGAPWFWSDQYDATLQSVGLVPLDQKGLEYISRIGKREGSFSVWSYANGLLTAVEAISDPSAFMVGKKYIEAGMSPDLELVSDPTADLKAHYKQEVRLLKEVV